MWQNLSRKKIELKLSSKNSSGVAFKNCLRPIRALRQTFAPVKSTLVGEGGGRILTIQGSPLNCPLQMQLKESIFLMLLTSYGRILLYFSVTLVTWITLLI